ncbi:ER membrane complex subunit 3 [Sparganum proliferum]
MRKHFFNDKEVGYFKVQKRENAIKNPISDPTMLTDMLKGNILNVMPIFKPMLQRGCETLVSLDASW